MLGHPLRKLPISLLAMLCSSVAAYPTNDTALDIRAPDPAECLKLMEITSDVSKRTIKIGVFAPLICLQCSTCARECASSLLLQRVSSIPGALVRMRKHSDQQGGALTTIRVRLFSAFLGM